MNGAKEHILEADEKNKYGYLEAIRDVVKNDGNK